jgi:DNA-binding MarR family transcriptional regulator
MPIYLHVASMKNRAPDIEPLVRAVYGLTALKRDMPRLAGFDHPIGLLPLAVVHRLAPARVKDVAHELHVDFSVASRQLTALASAGYIQREPDPDDRRAQLVSLTDAGVAALERAHERIVAVFTSVLEGWEDDELASLTDALTRLRSDYERIASDTTISNPRKEAA